MRNSIDSVDNSQFILTYSSLYDEFYNNKGVIRTLYYPMFLIRRLIYSIVLIFFNQYPEYQAFLNVAFTVVVIGYLGVYRVFKVKLILFSQILGEICIFIVFLTSSFLLYTEDKTNVRTIEDICIYTIICTIGIQLIVNLILLAQSLNELWKEIIKVKSIQFVNDARKVLSMDKLNEVS